MEVVIEMLSLALLLYILFRDQKDKLIDLDVSSFYEEIYRLEKNIDRLHEKIDNLAQKNR